MAASKAANAADGPSMTGSEYLKLLGEEYGRFVAVEPINVDGVRAFNVGDPVPVSHVERGVVDREQVRTTSSATGQAAVADAQES